MQVHITGLYVFAAGGVQMAERRKRKLIRQKCPTLKVIFLSQQTDSDVMPAALEAGAIAYIVKSHAFTDLPPALRILGTGNWRESNLEAMTTETGISLPLWWTLSKRNSRTRLPPMMDNEQAL